MMKSIVTFFLVFGIGTLHCSGQTWVDTLYQIQVFNDSIYGVATDFAGNERELLLDIAVPLDDDPPECGRPLLIAIHGGAWISGHKAGGFLPRVLSDFAKRGYVSASINYRLGMFETHQEHHCNISGLDNVEWDCLNMADTSEWHRAYFRGIQDAKGAVRYMINRSDTYNIDPDQVFLFGESAGGFIAMGTAFLDDISEAPTGITPLPDVLAPNAIYEGQCIQYYGFDTSIALMDFARPDLGSIDGWLNFPVDMPFSIKGVGSFYGGMFANLFINNAANTPPALYMFHQPNDLIVPYSSNGVLAGYSYCATMFPLNCAGILNRPAVYGSKGIADLIDDLDGQGMVVPEYQFDHTSNTADCFAQILNPALGGHQVDNYWLRTTEMAAFFASRISPCEVTGTVGVVEEPPAITVFPNPSTGEIHVRIDGGLTDERVVSIVDILGNRIFEQSFNSNQITITLDQALLNGIYFLSVQTGRVVSTRKLEVLR